MNQDREFDRVISAVASYNRRPRISPEEAERLKKEAHKKDPKHIKALERRKKRKRGGPK